MRSFLTRGLRAIAVLTVTAFGVHADYMPTGQVTVIPGNCDPCCSFEPCYGYAYNPPVFFTDCCGWFANVEFVYWKPYQEGISYGVLGSVSNLSPVEDSSRTQAPNTNLDFPGNYDSTFKYPRFDWDSGFRVGLGYRIPCDVWEVKLEFTHYRTDAHNSTSGNFGDFFGTGITTGDTFTGNIFGMSYSAISPLAFIPESMTHFDVDAHWKIQFNQLDLDFARDFYVGHSVTLKPIVGLRALFIDQKYDISYAGVGAPSETFFPIVDVASLTEDVKMSNDFKGVGLKAGLDSSYALGCGLAFYGEATGAIVYGQFDVKQRFNGVITEIFGSGNPKITDAENVGIDLNDTHSCLLAQADLAFGLRWRQMINCDQNSFTLRLGWEHHIIFDYNKFRNLTTPQFQQLANNTPSGSLHFYGLVFAASIDF